MNRESFVFYRSFFEAIDVCPEDMQLAIYKAIIGYALNGDEVALEGFQRAVFLMAKPQIDANTKRYMNGLKRGAPLGNHNNPSGKTKSQPTPNQHPTKS